MSLYTPPSSGDFVPYVKYNAKAGRWYVKKDGAEVEVEKPVFVADFANIKKAWMFFMEGQAPNIEYFPTLEGNLEQPSTDHKLGLSVQLFSKEAFGGVVKLESSSSNTCSALSDLYEIYSTSKESEAGKLPVVKVTGTEAVKGAFGTNFKPTFEIEKWVDRPAEFDAEAQPAPVAKAVGGSEF